MTRAVRYTFVVALIAAVSLSAGCKREVDVQTGTRVLCSFDHVISDDVHTKTVLEKEASKYRVRTVVKTCDRHTQAEAMYQAAQKALAAGDLKTARAKLEQVVAMDPRFADALRQLADVKGGKTPGVDNGDPRTSPDKGDPATDGAANTPAAKLTIWIPDAIEGYKAQRSAIDVFTVSRDYFPSDPDAVLMAIYAEQQRTAAGAKTVLQKLVKDACPKDSRTITINGRQAYFGTDGGRIAAIGFTEGPVMVGLQIVAAEKGEAASFKSELVAAAKQLP